MVIFRFQTLARGPTLISLFIPAIIAFDIGTIPNIYAGFLANRLSKSNSSVWIRESFDANIQVACETDFDVDEVIRANVSKQ